MKAFVVLSAFLAVAVGTTTGAVLPISPLGLRYIVAPPPVSYHFQDLLGQYTYGYNDGLSAKQEVRSLDGVTRGSYRYLDAEGIVQTVEYVADAANGFRVAGTNFPRSVSAENVVLPEQVVETPEVAAARAAHLAAIEDVQARNVQLPKSVPVVDGELPKQVEDTPEVAAARQAHLRALNEAAVRNSIAPSPIVQTAPVEGSPLGSSAVLPGFRVVQGIHGIPAPLAYSPILF